MKRKNKVTSALGVIVSIILIIVAAATLLVTILFAKKDTPELFGYYLYLQKSSAMEVADSADDSASIHANTVVFAKAYNGTDPLSVNNAVLCVLAPDDSSPIEDKDSDGYAIRRILDIKPNEETGELLYYPTTMQTDRLGTEPPITGSSIIGICEFEHSGLYSYITFVQTLPGILLLLALPCILLIAMIVMKIVRSRNRKLDENAYAFEESYDEVPGEDAYDEDYSDEEMDEPMDDEDDYSEDYAHEQTPPLYTPEISSTSTLDRKRISIAQNFTPKAVNPNSPYQKARTMQFKAQKDVPILNTAPYDQPQQSHENEYVGKYSAGSSANNTVSHEQPASYGQEQPVYHGAHEADGTSGGRVFRSNSSITSTIRKPNVDDILNGDPLARAASEPAPKPAPAPEKKPAAPSYSSGKRRNSVDNASVDDLLAMIADQKKKL
ncbi:MAG: hypothetical protein ACI4JD_03420 [Ruminococcus sp.]